MLSLVALRAPLLSLISEALAKDLAEVASEESPTHLYFLKGCILFKQIVNLI